MLRCAECKIYFLKSRLGWVYALTFTNLVIVTFLQHQIYKLECSPLFCHCVPGDLIRVPIYTGRNPLPLVTSARIFTAVAKTPWKWSLVSASSLSILSVRHYQNTFRVEFDCWMNSQQVFDSGMLARFHSVIHDIRQPSAFQDQRWDSHLFQ